MFEKVFGKKNEQKPVEGDASTVEKGEEVIDRGALLGYPVFNALVAYEQKYKNPDGAGLFEARDFRKQDTGYEVFKYTITGTISISVPGAEKSVKPATLIVECNESAVLSVIEKYANSEIVWDKGTF